ncbi:hypothetical protein [Novipirellula caenicola]|uniref:DUF4145 domain-containing protein n=1 Tax=Novipirellula caenicola TaxID=1536901 RepID=A0ABP9W3R5_9BACT
MAELDRIQKRFNELASFAIEIAGTSRPDSDGIGEIVDNEQLVEWRTSVKSLLNRVFGAESPTLSSFRDAAKGGLYADSKSTFDHLHAVFKSAKSDFDGGYLFEVRNLVHAEVFSDELEQAEHFLNQGYKVPAAVIAGTVLETTLREMCEQHPDLEVAKTDRMIADLAKKGVFNKMYADQLRAWMKTRNSAAHGKPDEFHDNDVTRMIDGIRDFVANQMS